MNQSLILFYYYTNGPLCNISKGNKTMLFMAAQSIEVNEGILVRNHALCTYA